MLHSHGAAGLLTGRVVAVLPTCTVSNFDFLLDVRGLKHTSLPTKQRKWNAKDAARKQRVKATTTTQKAFLRSCGTSSKTIKCKKDVYIMHINVRWNAIMKNEDLEFHAKVELGSG